MHDVNDHPMQNKLNNDLGIILAKTIKELREISSRYNVDGRELAMQFKESLELIINQN